MKKLIVIAVLFLIALFLAVPSQGYVLHGKRCAHGFVKKRKTVKRHHHRKRIWVCVKRKIAARPAAQTKLHSHLDPTYTRNPLDPFEVTYDYSASATKEVIEPGQSIAAIEPAPLPSGVLAFYSDGKLECAINVGGPINASRCPVNYVSLGQHTVTTLYTSGEQSATETEVEIIEPIPTQTSVAVSFQKEEDPSQPNLLGVMTVDYTTGPTQPDLFTSQFKLEIPTPSGNVWNGMSSDFGPLPPSPIKVDVVQTGGCVVEGTIYAYCARLQQDGTNSPPEPYSFWNEGHGVIATRTAGGGYNGSSASAPLRFGLVEPIPPSCDPCTPCGPPCPDEE